ncbi:MAG: hypothetical protein U0768_15745 [Anaerolineae bacterium]
MARNSQPRKRSRSETIMFVIGILVVISMIVAMILPLFYGR